MLEAVERIPGHREGSTWTGSSQRSFSKAMAEHADAAVVGLFGNYHTGEVVGTRTDARHERLGYRLGRHAPLTVSIDFERGWAWVCTPRCGITPMGIGKTGLRDPVFRIASERPGGHDAVLTLPSVTAAPLARLMSGND